MKIAKRVAGMIRLPGGRERSIEEMGMKSESEERGLPFEVH